MSGVLPTTIWITHIHRGFSIIRINEKGLKRSLFTIFCRREISWKDIVDFKVITRVETRIYLSRIKIKDMSYSKIVNNKNIIHLPYTEKVFNLIEKYTDIKLKDK